MKRLLLIVLPLLFIVGCSKPINDESLIDKNGLKYHPDSKELYSGKVFTNYIGGMTKMEGSYLEGKKDGLFTQWYDNGKKKSEEKYNKGIVGLINYFSIQGDTVISNDNKNMELVVNDYEQFLNGKWLLDKNNSTKFPKTEESVEIIFEFNEQTWTVKLNGKIEESIGVDYNQMILLGEKPPQSIFLNIIDFNNVDLNVFENNDKDDLELGVRITRINNNL